MELENFWDELLDTPEMKKQYVEYCEREAVIYALSFFIRTLAKAMARTAERKDEE